MHKTINIGLVGAGYWGNKLLPKFLAAPNAKVQSVCDIHSANRAQVERQFPGIATLASLDALLASRELDAVVIVTPPATHFRLAKAALEAGKHVWIEKPLALRLDEGQQLVQLASAMKRTLFVDHTFVYDPAVRIIRDLVQQGELGDIYHLFLQRSNLGRIKRDSNVWWNSAPHDASMILFILSGKPTGIHLLGYAYLQANLEDLNLAVIEMTGGTSAFIYHNWLYPENTAKLTVVGSKRLLVYEGKFEKRSLTLYEYQLDDLRSGQLPLAELPTTIPSKIVGERKIEGFQGQEPLAAAVEDFLEAIRGDHEPVSNGDFSLRVLAILEAGERSLRAGGARMPVDA
jgi:predicted dehydrogenase